MLSRYSNPQALLIDADDTLWENNIYFEQAIAEFMLFLNHQEMTHEEVRLVINEVERETIVERGYGYHSFAHSLVKTFERLSTSQSLRSCTRPYGTSLTVFLSSPSS